MNKMVESAIVWNNMYGKKFINVINDKIDNVFLRLSFTEFTFTEKNSNMIDVSLHFVLRGHVADGFMSSAWNAFEQDFISSFNSYMWKNGLEGQFSPGEFNIVAYEDPQYRQYRGVIQSEWSTLFSNISIKGQKCPSADMKYDIPDINKEEAERCAAVLGARIKWPLPNAKPGSTGQWNSVWSINKRDKNVGIPEVALNSNFWFPLLWEKLNLIEELWFNVKQNVKGNTTVYLNIDSEIKEFTHSNPCIAFCMAIEARQKNVKEKSSAKDVNLNDMSEKDMLEKIHQESALAMAFSKSNSDDDQALKACVKINKITSHLLHGVKLDD